MEGLNGQIRLENVSCAFCGCDKTQEVYKIKIDQTFLRSAAKITQNPEKFAMVVRCKECGLVYANPRWIFPDGVMPYSEKEEEQYFASTYLQRKIAFTELVRQIPSFSQRTVQKALDIGCGDGVLLDVCMQAGIQCDGLEISESLVRDLREKFGTQVIHNSGLEAIPENEYDAVFLINVIEHLPNPLQILQQIHRILKPGGLVLIHAPNFGGLSAHVLGQSWHQIDPLVHLNYFEYHTLDQMLLKSGLHSINRFYLLSSSPIKRIVQRIFYRLGIFIDNGLGVVGQRAS